MARTQIRLDNPSPKVVGSFGNASSLRNFTAHDALTASDIVEIRLDILHAGGDRVEPAMWDHLRDIPLLFTARRREEGGAADLPAADRGALLELAMKNAAFFDIEVSGIPEMEPSISAITSRGIPWIASFHDFDTLPSDAVLREAVETARSSGAAAFKLAAMLSDPADLARLAEFQLADHGIPTATMGMGPLAPVSRLLCAQCGSVLNYGFLGDAPTAPGQWDSGSLKQAIAKLAPFRR